MSNINSEEKQTTQSRRAVMNLDSSGVVTPTNIEEAHRYASYVVSSGLAPKHFDTPEKAMVAMQTARELNLPALTSLRQMYVVNGSVSLFGDLPLALVRRSGQLESISEIQYDKDGVEICHENKNLEAVCESAVCRIKRVGEAEVVRTYTWKEVVTAGLDKNKWGEKETYKGYRRRMLQMRARTWALKDVFTDVLSGIGIMEYDTHSASGKDVTVTSNNKALSLQAILDKDEEL